MEYVVGLLLLVIGIFFAKSELLSFFYKAKDDTLVKEDLALISKQNQLVKEVDKLKQDLDKPPADLSPEEVEEFYAKLIEKAKDRK